MGNKLSAAGSAPAPAPAPAQAAPARASSGRATHTLTPEQLLHTLQEQQQMQAHMGMMVRARGGGFGGFPASPPEATRVDRLTAFKPSFTVNKSSLALFACAGGPFASLRFEFDAKSACCISVYFVAVKDPRPEASAKPLHDRLITKFPRAAAASRRRFGAGMKQVYDQRIIMAELEAQAVAAPADEGKAARASGALALGEYLPEELVHVPAAEISASGSVGSAFSASASRRALEAFAALPCRALIGADVPSDQRKMAIPPGMFPLVIIMEDDPEAGAALQPEPTEPQVHATFGCFQAATPASASVSAPAPAPDGQTAETAGDMALEGANARETVEQPVLKVRVLHELIQIGSTVYEIKQLFGNAAGAAPSPTSPEFRSVDASAEPREILGTERGSPADGIGAKGEFVDNGAQAKDDIASSLASLEVAGTECVICLTERRSITILPCRHVCLCATCAFELGRQSSNKCPICRTTIERLLTLS
jgi:hypothetical protein